MNIGDLLLGLALLCVSWGVVSMVVMTSYVSDHGTTINFFLYRLYVIKYVNQYKQMTEAEDGKPGPWFYSFLISMNMALILTVVGAILKSFV